MAKKKTLDLYYLPKCMKSCNISGLTYGNKILVYTCRPTLNIKKLEK